MSIERKLDDAREVDIFSALSPEEKLEADLLAEIERGFFRTQLPLVHIFPNASPISRSEARRLASMIVRFEDVTLDFEGITNIGQGFTHELFVVFQRDHPGIRFSCVNMCASVENMIARVQNTK